MAVDWRTGAVVGALLLAAGGLGMAGGAVFGGTTAPTPGQPAGVTLTEPAPAPAVTTGPTPARAAEKVPGPRPAGPAVPVYVLGDTAGGARLYREFRPGGAAAAADPVRAALAGLALAPDDPDYRTAWTGATGRAERAGAVVTVSFDHPPSLVGQGPGIAVQQVVWTVTAADNTVRRVRVLAPGLPAGPAAGRAGQRAVLAPVWLLAPVEGGSARSALTVTGTASVYEAAVRVEVRRGTELLARTTATASVGAPGRGEWKATMTVPPGDYVVSAYEVSAQDGSRVGVDTKRVTVTGR